MARIAKDYGYTLAELRKLSDDDHMSIALRAEVFFDDEVSTWHYREFRPTLPQRVICRPKDLRSCLLGLHQAP